MDGAAALARVLKSLGVTDVVRLPLFPIRSDWLTPPPHILFF